MTSQPFSRPRARTHRPILLVLILGLLLGLLSFASGSTASAQECPEGSVLSDNGVTCELDVSSNDSICPPGQQLDAAGLLCEAIPTDDPDAPCPQGQELDLLGINCIPIDTSTEGGLCDAGQELDAAGLLCVDIPPDPDADPEPSRGTVCEQGYSLGRDGESCIADGPSCDRDEILNDAGECVRTFQCPDGLILASDLLSCISDRCPEGELLSVDGRRCVAPDTTCPDGSPRPKAGTCLVVETIEGDDGEIEVVVRCAEADLFCQAQVKQCADDRAASGSDSDQRCDDPLGNCEAEDETCEESSDRLVECAVREGGEGEDGEPVSIGGDNDPCADLCPNLHRLDPSGECIEFLDPRHPCVISGTVPSDVETNVVLAGYSFLAGTGQCVTRVEFLRRLGNFEEAAGAEATALSLLRETTSSYLTIEGQLAELDQLLLEAEREIRRFTDEAAVADKQRENNAKLLHFTQKRLFREQALLEEEALQVFVIGGNDALIEAAVLSSTNVTEISVAQTYGRSLLNDQVANIRRVESLEDQVQALSVSLDRAAQEVQASLDGAVASAESLDTLRANAEALREEQLARRQEEAELVAELRENKASYAQELGVFERDTLEITEIISSAEFRVTTFAEFDGRMGIPILPKTVISSNFGPRLHPILGYVRQHNGVDITASFGEEILATEDGVVQLASDFGGYGRTVVIDHGGDVLTLYAHMSVWLVEAGDEVQLGDTIGLVGSTGLSTGPHLHFEVWEDRDRAVDPRPYLTDAE